MTERRHRPLMGLAAALLWAGCLGGSQEAGDAAASSAGPAVVTAVATAPLAEGLPGAAYLVVEGGAPGDRLTGITGPGLQRVELHTSVVEDGRRIMRPVEALPVDGEGRLVLEPGGAHGMLLGVSAEALAADGLALTLHFRGGGEVAATARWVAQADLESALHVGGHD